MLILGSKRKKANISSSGKLTKLVLLLILVIGVYPVFSQIMVSPTDKPSSLIICEGDSTFSFIIANTSGSTISGATLTLDLPTNCKYIAGSIINAVELDITNLNQPTFSLPDILNNTSHNVDFNAEIICGYNNTEDFIYIVDYNSSVYTGSDTPLQNYYYPSIVITNITNSSATIQINQSITRDFTIEQQGLVASLDTLIILDEHSSDIEVISVNIGTLILDPGPGPTLVDTIIITGSDMPGGNNLFDFGEIIILSETVKLVGCTNGQSTINATWGCYGEYCESYFAYPSVSPASGVPLIDISYTGNKQGWGFIDNSGFIEFTVTNNGSGAGTAYDLITLSGFSSHTYLYYPNNNWLNEVDSFSVNGNYLQAEYNYAAGAINGQYSYYFRYSYNFDPDGLGVGIEDEDGDGVFDDLPVGHSVIVKAHTFYNWQEAQFTISTGPSCGRGWTNNAWQSFRYGYDLTDQCSSSPGATWVPNTNVLLFMTYNTNTLQHTIPADIYEGSTVWMEQQVSTSTKVEDEGCPNDSVIYNVELPDGVIIAGGTATYRGVSMGTPLMVGNTATYILNKNKVKWGGWFKVPLQIDCNVQHDPTATIETKLQFWCDKTLFPARYFTYWCSETPTFGIQCPAGSCTDPYITDFTVERTTMGWVDNQLSQKVDAATPGIELDHAMALDSIRIETTASLNGTYDSLYFYLHHANLPGTWNNYLFFNYISDTLQFYDSETNSWLSCANLSPSIRNGSESGLTLNISELTLPGGCFDGYTFSDGDSLRYIVIGKVRNVDRTGWETVPEFRAYFYNREFGEKKYCNDRGITYYILGSNLKYSRNTYINPTTIEGCDDLLFYGEIYRTLDICNGEITFPNEVRPYVVLDSITFLLPEGFVFQAGTAVHRYRNIDGTLISEPIADPIIEYGNNQMSLLFVRDANWKYSAYIDCWQDQDRIDFYATASCQTSSTIHSEIEVSGRYQFYADGIGITQNETASTNKPYTPSEVVLTPLITTAEGRYDTVYWDVRLCNVTNIDADNNWLAFESSSQGIDIIEIVDVTIPTNPIDIPVLQYGPGKSWGQLGSLVANECKIYQIKANYSSCSTDSLLARHTFNCAGYPINPELGYPPTAYSCSENSAYLFLEPNDVSLNLVVTSPTNPLQLCDTLSYEAEVTNTLLSYAYNLKLTVTVPPGVSFVPSTSEFSYPYSSGSYVIIDDPVNFPLGSNHWIYNISLDTNAIPILKGIDSVPNNGYKLRYKIITDCDLISGTSIKVTASASNACGAVKNRISYTSPIIIDGLPTNVNLYVLSTENDPYLSTCSSASTIKTKIINLGPNSVSSIELLSASIDDAYDYVPGSIVPIHNGPSGINTNIVIGGIRYLQFSIQPNLAINDSIVFTYELIDIDPRSLECDTIPLATNAMLVAIVPCLNALGGSCEIQSITSSLVSNMVVRKDNVEFGGYIAHSNPDGNSSEAVSIEYSIYNSGYQPFTSDSVDVVFVHDANGNGIADDIGSDSLYSQRLGVENLAIGDSVFSLATFSVPSDKVCDMLAAIRLSEDTCICSETTMSISDIQLLNAGADTTVCIQQTLSIGTDSIQGQSYIWVPSTYLNSTTISNPEFLYTGSLVQPDTLIYILFTNRQGGCINKDTVQIIIYPHAIANAGSNESNCESLAFDFLTSAILPSANYYDSVTWHGGTGSFNNPNLLFPIYMPGNNEVGPVELFLTAHSKLNCSQDISSMILTVDTLPDPGFQVTPNNSICVNEPLYFTGYNTNSTAISNWNWDFGDGNIFTGQNAFHSYSQSGSYSVSLSLTSSLGCIDSVVQIIVVNELPQADFDIFPTDTICTELEVNFEGNSTTNIVTWDWDFGDSNIGTGQDISHIYNSSGGYEIQLVVENDNTCSDTVVDSVYIRELPIANISYQPQDTSCLFDTVHFEGISSDNIILWDWDLGDGTFASGQNISHMYSQYGTYIISLVFSDVNGCNDTIVDSIYIQLPKIADFIVTPSDTSCVNETNDFVGITSDNIISWYWEFGDGNSDFGQNVSHEYLLPGAYKVSLIYTDENGCIDTVVHQKIIDDPNVSFYIVPSPICMGDSTFFTSSGDNITYAAYNWDMGDGIGIATGYESSYLYYQSGTYDVSLQVCSKNIVQSHIVNAVCEVDAGGTQATCQDVYFNYANSITPPTALGYASIYWTTTGLGYFNDPTLVTPTYFPHPSEGAIQNDTVVMMMVGFGIPPCDNDTSYSELIIIPGAFAEAGSNEHSCIDYPYDFANSADSSFATNYVTLYWLTSGTGYFIDPNVKQPVYVPGPGELGPITLTMVASNIINCDSIDDMILTIHPEYEVPINTTVCYYDSIFAEGEWHYTSGTYYDTLQSAFGCDSVIITNLIVRPKIDKDFVISTGDSICYGEPVTYYPTGSANIVYWLWDFGDGNTSQSPVPTHQYYGIGDYTIIFHYTDVNGCSDSSTLQVTVFELPDVSFGINMPNACVDFPVVFTGTSSSNIALWEWDFGDGLTGTGQVVSHTYPTWGTMMVTLTVTDIIGCSESTYKYLLVLQPSVAEFTFDLISCDSVQFTDMSSTPVGYNIVTWYWDFDDGSTSDLQNPVHEFPSNNIPGGVNYNVNLVITSDSSGYFCSNTVSHTVWVPSNPDIFFTWSPDPTCLGSITNFFGQSGFYIDQWHWDFDDGNFSINQFPSHIYADTGNYFVELSIADTNGCVNTLSNIVQVVPVPDVSFTMSDSVICHGSHIQFTSTSSTNVSLWYWEFGDGSFSYDQNPIHYYTLSGTYTVILKVTDNLGCSSISTNQVTILPSASADFLHTNLTCSTVLFTDLSTAPTGYNIVDWLWDFDDGFTATVQNPSHNFASGIGIYDVTLIVTADSGGFFCTDTIIQTVLTPGLPSVFFTWTPEPTMIGIPTEFFGTSGNTITNWYWDFGDGYFATTQNATHIFTSPGLFNVELNITDNNGCQNTVVHQVTVVNQPELDFSWNYSCEVEPIQFSVLSPPTDIPAVTTWAWDFGDGGISDEMEPMHVYALAGNYNVSLTITDTLSATATLLKQITVNPPPISLFIHNTPSCVNNEIQFINLSTTSTGYITHWHWDFGDGNTQTVEFPNNPNVTHTYTTNGTYLVSLTIINSDSCENISQNSITIYPSPEAMFNYNTSCANNPMSFTDNSIENGGGPVVTYLWNFDDPTSGSENTSNLQNPSHIYNTAGDYNVTLIVTNINGCIDTTINLVTVSDEPEIDFTYTEACLGNETEFDAVTTSNVLTYAWTFGDGGTSNEQNPTHIYNTAGDYTVTLSILTNDSCTAIVIQTVRVNPLPIPNFETSAPACLNQEIEFTNLSTSSNGLIEIWTWDFGDGNTTTIVAPDNPDISHLYTLDGIYSVSLTVTDEDGCENELIMQVEVSSSPIADYTFEEICYNDPVLFSDLSTTNGGADIQLWQWYFGDPGSGANNSSNIQNPSHIFSLPGTYTTTLIAVSILGCSDTTEQEIIVDPSPEVEFTILEDSICLGEFAEFEGTGTNISTWYWEFGDGGSSIDQNPSYMYAAPGVYTVTLTGTETGAEGCQNSISHEIVVNGTPETSFDYENTCIGDSTFFTDLSYSQYGFITGWDWDFGDGATSTLEDPTHLYNNNTDYQVTLIVTDNFGCTDTLSQFIHIFGLPIPAFSYDQVCDPEGQVNFFDESQPGSDGSPVIGWKWNFHENYFSTEIDPSYIFPQTDTCYTVILEVTDNNGCSASDTNYQVCLHGTLSIVYTSTTECLGQRTFFEVTYEPETDSIITYIWNFNDGSQPEITDVDTTSHIFPQAGTYMVGLTAVDTSDCSSTIYREVIVYSLPTPGFINSLVSCSDPVQFTDISLTGGVELSDWYWDFGDTISTINNTSTQQNPTHIYGLVDSTYHVKLIVTNLNGCIDSIMQDAFVEPCMIADYELPDGSNLCARNELCFTDNSALFSNNSEIEQWQWNFGDGNNYDYTNYQNKICHTYEQAGNYDVELVVTTTNNQITYHDTISKTLIVNPTPIAAVDAPNNCYQEITWFTDNTITNGAQISSWYWDFGDLSTINDNSTSQNTSYLYPDYGNYVSELFVENEYGCIDSITDTITIYKLPISEFSYREQCMSYYTYFIDESTSDSSQISQWDWNFGNLETETDISFEQSPVYIYDATGIYFPQLIVTDKNLCKDIVEYEIEIWPIPTSAFIIVDTNKQGQIYLQNQSKDATSYYWDLDYNYGQITTEPSPTHQYDEDGDYNIMLVSYNDFGCPDTTYQLHNILFTNLFVPNAFVPSNKNPELQTFKPVGVNLKNYKIQVYSTWGNLVFESTKLTDGSPADSWDGKYMGTELPTGSYIWHIYAVFENGTVWKGTNNGDGNTSTSGTVTLIR